MPAIGSKQNLVKTLFLKFYLDKLNFTCTFTPDK